MQYLSRSLYTKCIKQIIVLQYTFWGLVIGIPDQSVGDPVCYLDERHKAAANAQPQESAHLKEITFNMTYNVLSW